MSNNDFKIQTIRTLLNDQNSLYIKGFYLDAIEDAKIKVFADETELVCTEKKMPRYEEDDEVTYGNEDVGIETQILAKIPEIDTLKKIKIVYEDDNNVKTVLNLSGKILKKIKEKRYYNIDALEKIGERFGVRGWAIYGQKFELHLYDGNNHEIEVNTKLHERLDVEMAYPEVESDKKVSGFRCEFDYIDDRNIRLEIITDEQEECWFLDARSDFSGNKRLFAVLNKTLKTKGFWETVVIVARHLQHPIMLTQRVLNKLGIITGMKRYFKALKNIVRKVQDKYLLRTEYAELEKQYPYAMKRLLCLKEMRQIKQEKEIHRVGDVKFSILVPLFNTPVEFLNEMIESVQMQTYENWELCLADGSDEKHSYVGEICRKYQEIDSRVLYKKLVKNYGISGNTNECIKMATGNFIALFDHDDFLHPMVLQKCYEVIKKENADYVYTDEATFQVNLESIGTYHFKPDYAPDNLRANNYICHFSTFSKELLDKVGWYDSKYDGSQDHDLILRLTENAKCVKHIPEILYFWRSHPGSVAEDINSKVYAIEAGKKAVLASLERNGMSGKVDSSKAFPTIYRIKYDLLESPLISIIILNYNLSSDLKKCIESIRNKSTYENYEIIIVKNGSNEKESIKYYEELKEASNIKLLEWNGQFNSSAMNNFAVKYAAGKYVLFLSDKLKVITSEWMEELLMYAQRNDVAAVGAKLYYPNNTIRHAGIVLGMGKNRAAGRSHYKCQRNELGYMGRLYYAQNVSAVSAACMLMRKEVFEQLGGFDEEFVKKYYDVDLCVKAMKKGYLNVFTPYAEAYYTNSLMQRKKMQADGICMNDDVAKFKEKWKKTLEKGDKFFNKNFSLDHSCFEIKENNLFRK